LADTPEGLVFACSRSAGLAAEAADRLGVKLPAGFHLVKIPCACSLSEEILLDALLQGVQKVLVLGCHEDNCVSQKGTAAGRRRLRRVAEYLEASGRNVPACLQFASLASNESHRFASLLHRFEEQSPNPANEDGGRPSRGEA
jgi:coenzyme F420-reducing hydrogenase delta subunit